MTYHLLEIRVVLAVLAASTGLSLSVPVFAQTVPNTTRQELILPSPKENTPAPSVKVRTENFGPSECFAGSDDLRATITEINILEESGGALRPDYAKALAGITAPNKEQTLRVACDIRDQANDMLRKQGWLASVQIPPQELVDSLRLTLISAKLGAVEVMGDAGPYSDRIAGKIAQLKALSPFSAQAAERILFDLNDVPGLSVKLNLAPGAGGMSVVDGRLLVAFEPYAIFVNARNYNAKRAGRETVYGRYEYYGLTKNADVSYVGAQTTFDFKEQWIGQIGHEFGLGANGLRIGADLTYAKAKPVFGSLDFESEALIANLRMAYPLLRQPQRIADIVVGFDYADQSTDLVGLPLSKDQTRALYLRGQMSGKTVNRLSRQSLGYDGFVELRQGLSGLGATRIGDAGLAVTDGLSASRPFGQADSFVARAGLNMVAGLGPNFGVRAKGAAQWTDNPLLNYDEFAVGNLSIGRGYDPGASSGDRAIGGAFEVYTNINAPGLPTIQTFGFYDVVQVKNLDFGTLDSKRSLASMGGGLRMAIADGVQAELTYAKPLDRAQRSDLDKPADRLLFSITKKFPAIFN